MAELNVSKKSVRDILNGVNYVIPFYQRPYSWDEDRCDDLWNDIVSFFEENNEKNSTKEYYLGSLVTFNDNGKQQIIDGQQRITSFLLLLRVFYIRLENTLSAGGMDDEDKEKVEGLKNKIAPCLWEVDEESDQAKDKSKIRLESEVITSDGKDVFFTIMKGEEVTNKKSKYLANYEFFRKKSDEYANSNLMSWRKLCLFILNRCVLLPVECQDVDTALNIFSTLNDRGMPLSDADIFKAQIYKNKKTKRAQKEFIEEWKKLEDAAEEAEIEMLSLFRFYSHYIRGNEKTIKREKALRAYYAENKHERLQDSDLISNLKALADFWGEILSDEPKKYVDTEGGQYIHCLWHYPNDYWRYVVSVFFIKNKKRENTSNFKKELKKLLAELTAFYYVQSIVEKGVNAVKDDTYKKYVSLCHEGNMHLRVDISKDELKEQMKRSIPRGLEKGLLLLHAYLHSDEDDYIPNKFQIEHILPRNWKRGNSEGWNDEKAKKYLENIGNKIVIEEKLNVKASDNFFQVKKNDYKKSKIIVVKELGQSKNRKWLLKHIEDRRLKIIDDLISFFEKNKVISK